jgi:peptidoglycan/LPS O-acetylase OafA/YrhL
MSEKSIRTVLQVGALYHLALGGWFLLAPGSAYNSLAEFPPRNDHFLRDVSSFYLAFGLAFWVASRRPSWRAPVLTLAIVQYAIHTVVHVFDAGKAATDAKGIFAAVSLGLLTAGLVFVLGASAREQREARPGRRDRPPRDEPPPRDDPPPGETDLKPVPDESE